MISAGSFALKVMRWGSTHHYFLLWLLARSTHQTMWLGSLVDTSLQRISISLSWVYTQICTHKWSTIKWKLQVRNWGCERGIAVLEVTICFMIDLEATCIAGITSLLKSLGRDILGSKEAHTLTSLNVHVVNLLSKYLWS